MTKIVNLIEHGVKRDDGRSCYVSLPPQIQNAIITVVNLANQDDANDAWRGAQGTMRSLIKAQGDLYRAAEDLKIPRKTIDTALNWAIANTSLALRSTAKISAGSAPTAG